MSSTNDRIWSVQEVFAAGAEIRRDLAADLGEAWVNPATGAAIVRMTDVAAHDIDWLWERWIPARMLTILGGYGGDGKSAVMASLIGAWTTGGTLPDGTTAPRTNVLMPSAEDDVAAAIRPRLDHHGADPERVFVLTGAIRSDGKTRWFATSSATSRPCAPSSARTTSASSSSTRSAPTCRSPTATPRATSATPSSR